MKRRDFLTAFLGATATALVLPKLDILAVADPARAWQLTFSEVHYEATRLFRRLMIESGLTPEMTSGALLGEGVLRHQFQVALPPWEAILAAGDRAHERIFIPAMHTMVAAVVYDGVDLFGQLRADIPGMDYCANVGPVRMLCGHDVVDDYRHMSIGVIGGSSPRGLLVAQHRRQNDLKRSIRERLGAYQPAPLPA